LRYMSEDADVRKRLAEMPQAEISFNYLGQVDQVFRESELFAPAQDARGREIGKENKRFHVLDVVSIIVTGKLQVSWAYGEKVHRRETIEKLASRYSETLRELITHCRVEDVGGYTASDFPLLKLSSKEFKDLASLLDE
jgi:non-ribosomal peptide synthase protein (TIGR01720 family)